MKGYITELTKDITHIFYTMGEEKPQPSQMIADDFVWDKTATKDLDMSQESILFQYGEKEIIKETAHLMTEKDVYAYEVDGEPIVKKKQTANGEVSYIDNAVQKLEGQSFQGKLEFMTFGDDVLVGLGQYEDGIFNYKGKKEYVYQSNMRIAMPFILSLNHYGIFVDTESSLIFESEEEKITFSIDTTDSLSYYIIKGESVDEIVKNLRVLTGRAAMLPRWAFGYMQSKERYHSADELVEVTNRFRDNNIPLDCLVQDWLSWEGQKWGEKIVDKERYPDLKGTMETLHENHTKLMVSIWPNMAPDTENLKEFEDHDLVLPNSTTYDAFKQEGRDLYGEQCQRELFSAGVDAWWCDSAEPFSGADWGGEERRSEEARYEVIIEDSRQYMDWRKFNSYGLYHAKGIYDCWRKSGSEKRVVNLTRSSYISGQQYGAIVWSGDISASWDTMKNQIVEGMKMAICGMPYWTLDIGGFFTVKDKWWNRGCSCSGSAAKMWFWNGDYDDGVLDYGYRELYTRWLQMGTFLPIFRSHGTDTPREPWNFGVKGEMFYDTILKFIKLRYQLMPYIYSLGADVHRNHNTMMRSLLFDFADDKKVREITDTYLFGKEFLVSPVIEPMYYTVGSKEVVDAKKTKMVYLPEGTDWYNFWTNEKTQGGVTIEVAAEIDEMPLFVKAGSIIPVSDEMTYADELQGAVKEVWVYDGADGAFTWYNDEGDNYSYEEGNYVAAQLHFDSTSKVFTVKDIHGENVWNKEIPVYLIAGEGKVLLEVIYE